MFKESIYKRYTINTKTEDPSGACCFLVFKDDKVLLDTSHNKLTPLYAADLGELKILPMRTQYMGMFEEFPCYCIEAESIEELPQEKQFYDLRSLYHSADFDLFLLAGKALQIINWDKTHQFCGRCGVATHTSPKEIAKICPSCGLISYTRISPAVIVGIHKDDKILLAHSVAFKEGLYSIIAGFVEPGETMEDAVRREVMEEVGIEVKNIKYFGNQSWPFSSSLMIGFTAEYESGEICVDNHEITDAQWFGVKNLPELPPDYSIAREIIDTYIEANSPSI